MQRQYFLAFTALTAVLISGCSYPYTQPSYGYGYGAPIGYGAPTGFAPGFAPGQPIQQFPQQYPQQGIPIQPGISPGGSVSPPPMFAPGGTEINVPPGGTTYDPADTLGSGSSDGDFFGEEGANYRNERVPAPRDVGRNSDSEDLSDPDGFGALDQEHETPEFAEPFRDPVPAIAASSNRVEAKTQPVNSTAPFNVNVYDFDKDYRWLQGVLKKDDAQNEWYIVYDFKQSDEFGGDLTLLPNASLQTQRNGEIVLIKGGLNREREDKNGKPMYQISSLQIIDPAQIRR